MDKTIARITITNSNGFLIDEIDISESELDGCDGKAVVNSDFVGGEIARALDYAKNND